MGFHVDYNCLDRLYVQIMQDSQTMENCIKNINQGVQNISQSQNMAGEGADCIRAYMQDVHGVILASLAQLISAHKCNCLLYVQAYQSGIDSATHVVLDEAQLLHIRNLMYDQSQQGESARAKSEQALGSVSDIVSVGLASYSQVEGWFDAINGHISKLKDSVIELENTYSSKSFTETEQLIFFLTNFIKNCLRNGRSYKEGYTSSMLASNQDFLSLCNAYVAVDQTMKASQGAIRDAAEQERLRFATLQAEAEEMERRAKAATVEKWVVTGACVVISGIAIAATGGAAAPLAVAAISGVSGAVIAGNNAAADQYAATGSVSDWGEVGKEAFVGGITGAMTGYLGGVISQHITSGLSGISGVSDLLNSSSTVTRIGTHGFIGAASEVVSGIATRGVGTFTAEMIDSGGDTQHSLEAAKNDALDGRQILFDFAIGGVAGGIEGAATKPKTSSGFDFSGEEPMENMEKEFLPCRKDDPVILDRHKEPIPIGKKQARMDAVIKDLQGNDITEAEADAIQDAVFDYTDDSQYIRKAYQNPRSEYHGEMEVLDAYLMEAPKWEGSVQRGIHVSPETADKIIASKEIDMLGPSSWSTSEGTARQFAIDHGSDTSKQVNIIFNLSENKSGVDVTHLSKYGKAEQEVLAPSKIKYINDGAIPVTDGKYNYVYIFVHEE